MSPDPSLYRKNSQLPSVSGYTNLPHKENDGDEFNLQRWNQLQPESKKLLAKVFSQRVTFLKETLHEIETLIQERQELKQQLDTTLDEKLCQVQTQMYELKFWNHTTKDERRLSLEARMAALYKEKRQQTLLLWEDKVTLKRELRQVKKEFNTATTDLWLLQFLS